MRVITFFEDIYLVRVKLNRMTDFFPDIDDLLDHHAPNDAVLIETMIRAYYTPIYRLTSSILNDAAEAEDAVQETFIKATLNLDHYRTGTNFKGWLYAIAVNTCRGMLRKRNTREGLQSLMVNLTASLFRSSYAEEQVIESEIRFQLKTALDSLDEKHRLPVLLRFVHGLPIAEIAQILGVREGTVHSRLHYAIKKLRHKLSLELEGTSGNSLCVPQSSHESP
jgi:RNA polymerase sigma-70 factor, ECF subfamily